MSFAPNEAIEPGELVFEEVSDTSPKRTAVHDADKTEWRAR